MAPMPADATRHAPLPPSMARARPSAMGERQVFPVQTKRIDFISTRGSSLWQRGWTVNDVALEGVHQRNDFWLATTLPVGSTRRTSHASTFPAFR